jgi:hypothetical protein
MALGYLAVNGQLLWCARRIFRNHNLEYTTEFSGAERTSRSAPARRSHLSLCLDNRPIQLIKYATNGAIVYRSCG